MRSRPVFFVNKFSDINWFIVGVMSLIALMGFLMMLSAGNGELYPWALPQFIRFLAAFVVMLVIAVMPMRLLMDYAYILYFACVAVLILVDVMGHIGMGAQRWLRFGGLNIQPSEFTKLAVILALARYFHNIQPEDIKRITFLIIPALILIIPAILIYRQPNLGTTLIVLSVGVTMAFLAGVQWRYFIGAIFGAIAAAPVEEARADISRSG